MTGLKKMEEKPDNNMSHNVGKMESRKIKSRAEKHKSIWFGLGMFGHIGWSVALPTLIGIGLGIWIDSHWPGRWSWTLVMLILGLGLGCLNAWHWVMHQSDLGQKDKK